MRVLEAGRVEQRSSNSGCCAATEMQQRCNRDATEQQQRVLRAGRLPRGSVELQQGSERELQQGSEREQRGLF